MSVVAKEKVEKRKEIFASGDIVGTKTVSVLPSIIKKAGPGVEDTTLEPTVSLVQQPWPLSAELPQPLCDTSKTALEIQEGVRAVNIRRCLRLICKTGK